MTACRWKCTLLGMLVFFAGASLFATPPESQGPKVTVGSKAFTESGILGEMLALLARHEGAQVEHRSGLTGTQIAWRSLQSGAIDAYVEYTGTIRKEILTGHDWPALEDLRRALAERGISMSRPL
ncbi:MAG TPA: glycine betaine ABC transporter substrate-binding protein, partial [Gemmataceae bacterium]|nr:glycine betaine ABC transporter substrate-binding protein [Gemmataceae bacterium]